MLRILLLSYILIQLPVLLTAQDTAKVKTQLNGYADVYYSYDFNAKNSEKPYFIYSHKRHNDFSINNLVLFYSATASNYRGNIALQTGTFVQYNYASEPELLKHIYLANVGVRVYKNWWAEAGVFSSHIGMESALSRDNINLTRSLIAESSPYYETGARLNYEGNDKIYFSFLVLNGWQNIRDLNSNKALGTQLQFKPNSKWIFNSSTFWGNELPDNTPRYRFFHDFFVNYNSGKKWVFAGAFDFGIQEKLVSKGFNNWTGGALQAQFKMQEKVVLNGRFEFYRDKANLIITPPFNFSNGFKTTGASAGVDILPSDRVMWRNEIRVFKSPYKIFERGNSALNHDLFLTTSLNIYI